MSRSPFLTVLALGLGALPYLLTAFIGGVLADRVDRARLLASIYCAKALVYALIWEMWATVLLSGISHIGSLQAQWAVQTR